MALTLQLRDRDNAKIVRPTLFQSKEPLSVPDVIAKHLTLRRAAAVVTNVHLALRTITLK